MASPAPQMFGSYVIERELARGSMGYVYVAHHSLTHARVALKVLRAEVAGDQQAEERFLREVRAAAHIGHEGIVQVHDAGRTSEGLLYLAMELLEGETLEARLRSRPGERLDAMAWLFAVLDPLCAAHAQGIVHRDLKPANVFIATGPDGKERLKLLDFGLARDMREKSMTATGIALGTPYYMSPEQATQPRNVNTPSDVWSMGVMMYEVLCGTMPFDGETLHAVVIHASTTPHVPVLQQRPELDPRLASLVDACLSKELLARPRDASALRELLAPLLDAPEVQNVLGEPVAITARRHDSVTTASETRTETDRMPFAETAISLMPGDELLEASKRMHDRAHGTSHLGLWILVLALLAAGVGAFFWMLGRDGGGQSGLPPTAAVKSADDGTAATSSEPRKKRRARKPGANSKQHDKRAGEAQALAAAQTGDASAPLGASADAGPSVPHAEGAP